MVEAAVERFGSLHTLVLNAGAAHMTQPVMDGNPELAAVVRSSVPLKRFAAPGEIAEVIAFRLTGGILRPWRRRAGGGWGDRERGPVPAAGGERARMRPGQSVVADAL
jgi:NAD(P)-dependent dehydrogenase (short-subunit alcohol dehydrogenase family)